MGFFDWLRGNRRKQLVRLDGPGDFEIDIVGESHYQRALNRIAGGKTEDGHELECEAILIHEDSNPHDDQAIAVTIDGDVVGYLERRLARQFRKLMKQAGAPGHPAVCMAVIVGGWDRGDGDTGHYGVRLDLPYS